jgi:hypothetical protein
VDLVVAPDLSSWQWKDEDEYAHVRRLGIVTDTEHQAVDAARDEVLAMLAERSGPFADAAAWSAWRWKPAWPAPRLPQLEAAVRSAAGGRRLKPGIQTARTSRNRAQHARGGAGRGSPRTGPGRGGGSGRCGSRPGAEWAVMSGSDRWEA